MKGFEEGEGKVRGCQCTTELKPNMRRPKYTSIPLCLTLIVCQISSILRKATLIGMSKLDEQWDPSKRCTQFRKLIKPSKRP